MPQAGLNIFPAERGIFPENLIDRVARRQKLQDGLRRDARSAHNRTAIANFWIDNDSINHVANIASIECDSKDKTSVRLALFLQL